MRNQLAPLCHTINCNTESTQVWDDMPFCDSCADLYWRACLSNPEVFVFEPTATEMQAIEKEILHQSGAKTKRSKKYKTMLAEYLRERELRIRKREFDNG